MISADGSEGELQFFQSCFRGRRVLVTGAFGFIGSAIVRRLVAAGAELRLLRRTPRAGDEAHGMEGAIVGDVRDRATWERALPGIDTVFHLAAQTSTMASERDPELDYAVNAEATRTMLEECRRLGSSPTVLF